MNTPIRATLLNKISIFLLLALINYSAPALAKAPQGWSTLKKTIENTPFTQIATLRGQTFDLKIEDGANELLTLRPAAAFQVERDPGDTNRFHVTIINPDALVKEGALLHYLPIGWSLESDDTFEPQITGLSSCLYHVIFSQTGGEVLDLSRLSADYDVSYELSSSDPDFSVVRSGEGYDIHRPSNSNAEARIRLLLTRKDNTGHSIKTEWVNIPLCKEDSVPAPQEAASAVPPLSPTPAYQSATVQARDALTVKIGNRSYCRGDTGLYCTTLTVLATNTSAQSIKCNSILFAMIHEGEVHDAKTYSVEVSPGETFVFKVVLESPQEPRGMWEYEYKKEGCYYQ